MRCFDQVKQPEKFVTSLHIYPVNSLKGIDVSRLDIEINGPRYDRRWTLVDEEGEFLSLRQIPKLSQLGVEILPGKLLIRAKSVPPLVVKEQGKKTERTVALRSDSVAVYDEGDEAAEWFEEVIGRKCRLVHFSDEAMHQVNQKYVRSSEDHVAFSDSYPILITSGASLGDLNFKLSSPVSMNRFRPNIVISGCEPYEENSWKLIRVGSLILSCVKPCSRCIAINVDYSTGERGDEPLKTLEGYRKDGDKIVFGENCIHQAVGTISVGDEVEVLEFRSECN